MITTLQKSKVEKIILNDDGTFPNNASLPLIIYRHALQDLNPSNIENTFKQHNWVHAWRDGIYDYHHYHSKAHEVLGVYKGNAMVLFGGGKGVQIELKEGDAVVIPAGVAHKCVNSSYDFKCVGAYPNGQTYDMNYGKPEERLEAETNIKRLPIPKLDPIYGFNGPLKEAWLGKPERVIYETSKENEYRRELEHQLDDSLNLKKNFIQLYNTYKRNFFDRWFASGFAFLFELVFYILFFAFAVATVVVLFNDPLVEAWKSVLINSNFTAQDVTLSITVGKAALLLLSLFWLSIALMLRGIRIRNNWIDTLVSEFKHDIQVEEERENRIKNVL